jgi:nucleoside phosphorylase
MSESMVHRFFNAIIVVPLEEEFDVILEQFTFLGDLSNDRNIRFATALPGFQESYLLVKQFKMGRTASADAATDSLADFDTALLICVGIAGGLSKDVSIGDVCYTGTLADVLDNAKLSTLENGKDRLTLSPTFYNSPRELSIPMALDRVNPTTKHGHQAWAAGQGQAARNHIPGEFSGRSGRRERIRNPSVWEGVIVCGSVSDSSEYNEKLRGIERKVLALETESGGLFSVAERHRIPALTMRGISDFAGVGISKGLFEEETGNNARKIAAFNVATFLRHQLGTGIRSYLAGREAIRITGQPQGSLFPRPRERDRLEELLVRASDDFERKLRALSPTYSLLSKGYRLPIPRVRILERSSAGEPKKPRVYDLRDTLDSIKVATVHVPREYPDLSLPWTIAHNLLSQQMSEKQLVPFVIEGRMLHRRTDLHQVLGPDLALAENAAETQLVFIIEDADFGPQLRADSLNFKLINIQKRFFLS